LDLVIAPQLKWLLATAMIVYLVVMYTIGYRGPTADPDHGGFSGGGAASAAVAGLG
jgi:hypothetical protein